MNRRQNVKDIRTQKIYRKASKDNETDSTRQEEKKLEH